MAILLSLIAFLIAFAAGAGAVTLLCRGKTGDRFAELAGTALLMGAGIVSLLSFCLGLVIQGSLLRWTVTAVCLAFPVAAWVKHGPPPLPKINWRAGAPQTLLVAAAIFQLAVVSWLSLYRFGLGWDGLFVWEAKAQIAFANHGAIPLSFYTSGYEIGHVAYPVFLPVFQAWIYEWLGHIDQIAVKSVGPYFYLGALLLITGYVRRIVRSPWLAIVAVVLLGSVPALIVHEGSVSSGYADFPLAVVFLCALVHSLEYWRTGSRSAMRMAGAAALWLPFLKAEGAILLFCLMVAVIPKLIGDRDWRAGIWMFAPGIALWLAWNTFLRLTHVAMNVDFLPMTWSNFIVHVNRAGPLIQWTRAELTDWRRWSLLWPLTALAIAVLLASKRRHWDPLAIAVLLPLFLYPTVFFFSAWGPGYRLHVNSALWRLYIQAAPAAILAVTVAFGKLWGGAVEPEMPPSLAAGTAELETVTRWPVNRAVTVFVFLGIMATYAALSPGTVQGMGYSGEELRSGDRILTRLDAFVRGVPMPPMIWSRHGALPVLFDLPFIALGKFLVSPDFILSMEPVLCTTLLCTVLFLWLRRMTSPGMSLFLALAAAFGTLLWPYAYIGLETKQSLFVLLAGFWGLTGGKIRGWPKLLLFSALCGFTISLKAIGLILFPPIAYLIYLQFHDDWRSRRFQLVVVLAVIGALCIAAIILRAPYWGDAGALPSFLMLLVDHPLIIFSNWIGIFGSPTKGLFVYAPVLLLCVFAIPQTLHTHRQMTIFVLLLVGGITAFLACLRFPADELWGSRYMHATVAPLLLCIGAARPRVTWRKEAVLILLTAVGVVISFLGGAYWYAVLQEVATGPGQNTEEWMDGDTVWNPIRLHARLFRVWLDGGTGPVLWTPVHLWVWEPLPDAKPWKSVDLRQYCEPQSAMLRYWRAPKTGKAFRIEILCLASLLLGVMSILAALVTIRKASLPRLTYPPNTTGPPPGP